MAKNKIEVRNSSIVVNDYTIGDCPTLENYLSVKESLANGHWVLKFVAFQYDEDEEKLYIPRGYNTNKLQGILKTDDIVFKRDHDPSKRIILNLNIDPRDSLQEEAIFFLLEKGQYNKPLYDSQKFLCLKTGIGKTYCSIHAITKLKRRAIIIVDSLNIMSQWKEAFLEYTDIKETDICLISGSKSILNIMKKDKDPEYKVYIAMYQTLNNLMKNGTKAITNFFLKIKVGIKIYDEAHVGWNYIFAIDAFTNTEKTFYLTATPGRSDPKENALYHYVFDQVPRFGRNDVNTGNIYKYQTEERENKYIKVYYVKYNSHPSSADSSSLINKYTGKFSIPLYGAYLETNGLRHFIYIICRITDLCINNREKCENKRRIVITFVKNDIIKLVYELFTSIYLDYSIGRFCGLVKKSEKEEEKYKDIILTTDKSLGKAINVENIGYFINTVPFASSVIAEQLIGRLRKNERYSHYFDITDVGFNTCKNCLRQRSDSYSAIALSEKEITYEPEGKMDEYFKSKGIDI